MSHDPRRAPAGGGEDPVGKFLRARGSADFVIRGGLEGLLSSWERAVDGLARGTVADEDDHLNDADGRQILEEALDHAPPAQRDAARRRLCAADEKVEPFLSPPGRCLWGEKAAAEKGWTAEKNWWYFRRPVRPAAERP